MLVFYVSLRYLFEDRSSFSYGGKQKHQLMEEESPTCHLAPHGVPTGIARDLSSSKLNAGTLLINMSILQRFPRKPPVVLDLLNDLKCIWLLPNGAHVET